MFRRFWTTLTRMRTAIILLFVLGAAATVGSFFPQRPIDPRGVREWLEANPGWGRALDAAGIFDVYGSPWFLGIAGLLLVSLVGCMQRRYRAQFRAVRAEPRNPQDLSNRERYVRATVAASPDEVLAVADKALRRRRFRRAVHGTTIAAERGHLRESGSLVFHTSILVVLAGVALAALFGASGQALVVEGDTFTDTYLGYDSLRTGRYFSGKHTGFKLALEDFTVEWHPSGIPRLYESDVRILEADGDDRTEEIRVNEPAEIEGRTVYQISWGWAPILQVRQDGRVLYEGPTVFLPEGGWTGVAKIPQVEPQQMALAMQLFVDPFEDEEGTLRDRNRQPRNPVIVAQVLAGDLNLDRPQNVYALDPTGLSRLGQEIVGLGRETELPNGVTLAFVDLVQYSVFQVGYNPGGRLLLLGSLGLLIGLLPGLYAFRRRLWVRATPTAGGTLLEIAGHAFQRKTAADEEFSRLVAELDGALARRAAEERTDDRPAAREHL